jgi:hypothetical protein
MVVLPEINGRSDFHEGALRNLPILAIVIKRSAHIGKTLHKSFAIIAHHDISQEVYKKTSLRDFADNNSLTIVQVN